MKKNEFELELAKIKADRFKETLRTIRHLVTAAFVVICFGIAFLGITEIAKSAQADQISALAKFVNALNLGDVILALGWAGTGVAWKVERTAKKRAIREKAKYQKQVESSDAYRPGSGLTDVGDTPEGED